MTYVAVAAVSLCAGAVVFLLCFLAALCRDRRGTINCVQWHPEPPRTNAVESGSSAISGRTKTNQRPDNHRPGRWAALIVISAAALAARAQATVPGHAWQSARSTQMMQTGIGQPRVMPSLGEPILAL